MNDPSRRASCLLLLAAILLCGVAVLGFMVYSSMKAPDPASRPPKGALPPSNEPVRPVS